MSSKQTKRTTTRNTMMDVSYSRKYRVGFLGHGLFYGGATTSLYLLIKSFHQDSYEKYLLVTSCRANDMRDDFLNYCKEVRIVDLKQIHNNQCGHTSLFKFYYYRLFSSKNITDAINELGLDIIHINTTVFPHLLSRIKNKTKAKIIVHVRELIPKYSFGIVQKYMISQIDRYADAVLAISDNESQPFKRHSNLQVLANPFDFSAIKSITSNFREINGIPENCVLVGMLGQFHKHKGHLDFLKALSILLADNKIQPHFMFIIIGVYPKAPLWKSFLKMLMFKSDYRKIVYKFIKNSNLEGHLKLINYSYNIFGIIKAMDIIVRPSTCGDPWGRDIIESMAMGKPIVATGTSEFFIDNNYTGYLVPPKNPNQLAAKIADLILNPDKARTFGQRGLEKIRKLCDMDSYGMKIKRTYDKLLNLA